MIHNTAKVSEWLHRNLPTRNSIRWYNF